MHSRMEFFFFIGSTYSYLSVSRAGALAAQAGVELVWRPFSARTIMREQDNIPFATKPVKMKYMWRDVERRAARLGVPFDGVPPYPVDADELANHVATLAARERWCPDFAQAAYSTWFLGKRDPGQRETLHEILEGLGRDPGQCIDGALDASTRQAYSAATGQARQLGIFGSPSFVAGEEIFWGDDRLEDALAWCRAH